MIVFDFIVFVFWVSFVLFIASCLSFWVLIYFWWFKLVALVCVLLCLVYRLVMRFDFDLGFTWIIMLILVLIVVWACCFNLDFDFIGLINVLSLTVLLMVVWFVYFCGYILIWFSCFLLLVYAMLVVCVVVVEMFCFSFDECDFAKSLLILLGNWLIIVCVDLWVVFTINF